MGGYYNMGIHVCFKCNSAYSDYESHKSKGEFTSKEYMKYLCPQCYDEQVEILRRKLGDKVSSKTVITEEF